VERRRGFDRLLVELSLAVGTALPRYPLWLALHEAGLDPEALGPADAPQVCETVVPAFLAARGLRLRDHQGHRLRRTLERFDPRFPPPEERFARG